MAGVSMTPRVRFRIVAMALGAVIALAPAVVVASAGAAAAATSCTNTAFIGLGDPPTAGSIASAGQVDCYQYFAKKGQAMRVRVVGTGGGLVPSTAVDGPSGGAICGPSTNADQTCKASSKGLQTIAIQAAANTGSYTVQIQLTHLPVNCASLGFANPPNTGTIVAGAMSCFTFKAPAGSHLVTRAVATSGSLVPQLEELNAKGNTQCGPDATLEQNCRLLSGGNETLFVEDAAGPNAGSFALYAQLTRSVGCTTLKLGKAVQSSITSAGQTDCYHFTGVHGHRMRVTVATTSGALVANTEVFKPNGTSFCATSTVTEQSCRLSSDGTHTVYVSDVNGTATGNYTIYVQDLAAPQNCTTVQYGNHGDQHPATISFPGAENCYLFAGTGNTGAHLTVKTTSGSLTPAFDMYVPSGGDFVSGRCDHSATDERCLLPTTGTYLIIVRDASAKNTGSYYYTLTERIFS
jgi:hypothetical protein